MRGDVQECRRGAVPGGRRIRRGETETSLQHKAKSSIRHMVDPRTSDPPEADASKVAGSTPGEPLRSLRTQPCRTLPEEQGYRLTKSPGAGSRP